MSTKITLFFTLFLSLATDSAVAGPCAEFVQGYRQHVEGDEAKLARINGINSGRIHTDAAARVALRNSHLEALRSRAIRNVREEKEHCPPGSPELWYTANSLDELSNRFKSLFSGQQALSTTDQALVADTQLPP